MFMNAFIPDTKLVPAIGTASTSTAPYSGQPLGCASIPAKMAAKTTEMKVKNADPVPIMARVLNVRGIEQMNAIVAVMALKPMVQIE